jgi:hypothetical protein
MLMAPARAWLSDGTRVSREAGPGVPLKVALAPLQPQRAAPAVAPDMAPDVAPEMMAARDRMRQSREAGPGAADITIVARIEPSAGTPPTEDAAAVMATVATVKPAEAAALIESAGTAPVPATAPAEQPAEIAAAVVLQPAPDVAALSPSDSGEGDLTGLTDTEVQMLLGPPLSVRRDDPAEAWQYATADCILDLFFYQETGSWRVAHIEARTIAALDAPADACVKSVLAGRVIATGQS